MVQALQFTARRGRIAVEVRALPLGGDWCLLVTGGDRPHFGAAGWGGTGLERFSVDLPQHRDRAVVDVFLEALRGVPGNHLVAAGIHVDGITPAEIDDVLGVCAELAPAVVLALAGEPA